mgnify:FL=1
MGVSFMGKVYDDVYKGLHCVVLESEEIKAVVLPELGGKMASLKHKKTGKEILFQNKESTYRIPRYGAAFSEYDASGFDEMFPTIDECIFPDGDFKGVHVPDHGELWSIPWGCKTEHDSITLSVKGIRLPYLFQKKIRFKDDNTIRIDYSVKNLSDYSFKYLWAMHDLTNCDENTEIIMPEGTEKVINVKNSVKLGKAGTVHNYPITRDLSDNEYSLNRVQPRDAKKTEKYYVLGKIKKGEAGFIFHNERVSYKIRFPEDKVPFLGFWVTEGGFRGDYNCALEPSTGFYDDIVTASSNNKVSQLEGNAETSWYIEMEVKLWDR